MIWLIWIFEFVQPEQKYQTTVFADVAHNLNETLSSYGRICLVRLVLIGQPYFLIQFIVNLIHVSTLRNTYFHCNVYCCRRHRIAALRRWL